MIALRRIGELRDPAAARAWLTAILVNVCRGQLRSARVATGIDPWDPPGPDTAAQAIDDGALRDWVWTALERLSEPLRLAVMLRYFTGASSYEAIAERVRRARRHGPQPPERGEAQARRGAARDRGRRARRSDGPLARAAPLGEAYLRLQRDGDLSAFDGVLTPDVAYVMYDRIERHGATRYAEALAGDFEDGVRSRVGQVIPGSEVTIVEAWLDSPPDQPLHCPPALTQVHFHPDGPTSRIVSHYAPVPARTR